MLSFKILNYGFSTMTHPLRVCVLGCSCWN